MCSHLVIAGVYGIDLFTQYNFFNRPGLLGIQLDHSEKGNKSTD